MAVTMTAARAMASMRWTVISMPSVAWMRPVVRWAMRVMMVVVARPVCRPPVVVRAAIRLIDVGIAIPVAVSRACRVAARQKQDERRDSKQFLHVRSLDGPNSRGFSMCKPGFVQTTTGILRDFLLTCPQRPPAGVGAPVASGECMQMAKWPLDGKPACFCSFCLGAAAVWDGSCALPLVPAKALRNGVAQPGMHTRLPGCSTAALRDG